MLSRYTDKFWNWYEKHYALNVGISAFLFLLQLVHLYWLSAHVICLRLFQQSFFDPSPVFETVILLIDYTEIPALLSVSLIYIHGLRKKFNYKDLTYLLFLNSQWIHMFWITDEYVLTGFFGPAGSSFPVWLAWTAILIDYLELPVMYDTIKKFFLNTYAKVKRS